MEVKYKMTRKQVEFMIYDIINTFNGRINKVNTDLVIDINWLNMYGSAAAAVSYPPNRITVYPMVIYRGWTDENHRVRYLKPFIIETVLHEMSHQDQVLNYNKYSLNTDYKRFIEYSNQHNTVEFILENFDEICSRYDLTKEERDFFESRMYNDLESTESAIYERKTNVFEHMMHSIFFNILDINTLTEDGKDIVNFMYNKFMTHDDIDITLIINGVRLLLVYKGNVAVPLNTFNRFIYSMYPHGCWIDVSYMIHEPYYKGFVIDLICENCGRVMCIPNNEIIFKEGETL